LENADQQRELLVRRSLFFDNPIKGIFGNHPSKKDQRWLLIKSWFTCSQDVKKFFPRARDFVKYGIVSTMFLQNTKVSVGTGKLALPMALELFQLHGKLIRELEIVLPKDFGGPTVADSSMESIIECLRQVPSLQSLILEETDNGTVLGEIWENFVAPIITDFPKLVKLTELYVETFCKEELKGPAGKFYLAIFKAIKSTLVKLTCNPSLLANLESIMTLNLQELTVFIEEKFEMWPTLFVNLNLPILRRLEIRCSDIDILDFIPVLDQVSNTLVELNIGRLNVPAQFANDYDTLVFTKLESLTLRTFHLHSFWANWALLKDAAFPKLDNLIVESPIDLGEENSIPASGGALFNHLPVLHSVTFFEIE